MLWVPYILLIFIGLFCNNSKIYDFCVIVFMGLVAWLNTGAADYSVVYLPTYLNPFGVYDMDLGWSWLCALGARVGLYYNGFACILTVVSMILYREFGRKIGTNTSFMLALFLVFPGLMSLVQFRQFVASAVGCVGLAHLWTSKMKSRYVVFGTLMVLAILIHRSAVVLLFALLPTFLAASGKRRRVVVLLVLMAIGCILFVNWRTLSVQLFGEMRTSVYLGASGGSNGVSVLGGLRNAILLLLMAVLPYLCNRYMARIKGTLGKELFEWEVGRAPLGILFINVVLLVLVPVVFLTNDFMRFERHGLTMALGLFAMMPSLKKRAPILSCKALYVTVCLVFAYFYVANTFDSVYVPLLNPQSIPPFFI